MSIESNPLALRGPDGLAVIGRTLHDLRGIRFDGDEGGNAPASETPPAAEQPPAPEEKPAEPPAPGAPEEPPATEEQPETFSREYVEKLRKEAAGYREKVKTESEAAAQKAEKDLVEKLGKAMGLIKDDEQPDAAALISQAQTEREQAQSEAASSRRELAVLKIADEHSANTTTLLDSRAFVSKLEALDTSADDFASQVEALVKDAVESDPKFKRVQMPAGTGSATHSGEGATQLTREQFAALSPEERLKAAKDGRISGLLGK